MRVGRWAVVTSVALAVSPGAMRLVPSPAAVVERPAVARLERSSAPITRPVAVEVPITPPGELVGAVAEPAAAPRSFSPRPHSADGQVYALVIGINDYPGDKADLRSAVADANTIDLALDGFGIPDGNRVVLRDGQARRHDVVAATRSLAVQGGPNSTLVFAYAGHVRKLDSNTEELVLADGETITDAELAALVSPATTQRMWFLLATCYAGGFTELLGPRRVLTGAADANHYAYESPTLNASFLVHYMVREAWLEGGSGPSVQDAFAYADAALAREHAERRPIQVDQHGTRIVLGPGDPAKAGGTSPTPASHGPPPPQSSPPPSTTTTTTTRPPEAEESCLLGVLCST